MAVPKKRTSKSKRNMRRSHHGLKGLKLTVCAKCKSRIRPHMACPVCGTYKGREVAGVAPALKTKDKK